MIHHILEFIHIVAVISWMAGLLYLPRLFVYHAQAAAQSDTAKTLGTMEHRLLHVIMNPAMIVTYLSGIWLLWENFGLAIPLWLWIKAALVLGLSAFQGIATRWHKDLVAGNNSHPSSFFRRMNEVPTVLMILIVALVVFQPF